MKPVRIFLFNLAIVAVTTLGGAIQSAQAQDCMIGEIKMFGGNFAPSNWALADGQLIDVSSNEALFSILGTTFGGDGRTTFALPDLRGRFATHPGDGPGLTPRRLGARGGEENVTLNANQMPVHNHGLMAHSGRGDSKAPEAKYLARSKNKIYNGEAADVEMAPSIGTAGGGNAHNNMPPFLGVNHIICLEGIFPSRD